MKRPTREEFIAGYADARNTLEYLANAIYGEPAPAFVPSFAVGDRVVTTGKPDSDGGMNDHGIRLTVSLVRPDGLYVCTSDNGSTLAGRTLVLEPAEIAHAAPAPDDAPDADVARVTAERDAAIARAEKAEAELAAVTRERDATARTLVEANLNCGRFVAVLARAHGDFDKRIDDAVAAEREACARACEASADEFGESYDSFDKGRSRGLCIAARAIRARGGKGGAT